MPELAGARVMAEMSPDRVAVAERRTQDDPVQTVNGKENQASGARKGSAILHEKAHT